MGIITCYVLWCGHTAGGTLPPMDVCAGVIAPGKWRPPTDWPPIGESEMLVYVPPQWIGDWENGGRLAPGYEHVWRALACQIHPLPSAPAHAPYRPDALPDAAILPRSPFASRRRANRNRSFSRAAHEARREQDLSEDV